ncbi:hypothetical protein CLAFUW4_13565 [Fulvia fulva]|uniref:Uncharacterized protein n=1 Tax=Passalora fulva TaxID=5499 RepID=A0A9Q8PLH4_PASFU|nr:uncharacterized protein CLAFUR5_13416 [Fulvia fulva]KAK4610426.1 hypothetical protein CLAFUR4_13567 [Fulvia fulva]KAK4611086.1 hypothetical protein CLAFUR0_13576 [Fulvia fulva]UJO24628.1 hypothetical protein CLAFUR5_13416 [Fulvia fulva]WPV22253.1 hypothetical protein CLAFUW4_13565 [Fulvia fulva]WPV37272.1 hypothetical protein CLAFUW7_13572 [Fulvia fulva]
MSGLEAVQNQTCAPVECNLTEASAEADHASSESTSTPQDDYASWKSTPALQGWYHQTAPPRTVRPALPATAQRYIQLLEYILSDGERVQEARHLLSAPDAPSRKRTKARDDLRSHLRRLNTHVGDITRIVEAERASTGSTILPGHVASTLEQNQAAVARLQELVVSQRDVDQELASVQEHIRHAETRQAGRRFASTKVLIEKFKSSERRLQQQKSAFEACWRDMDGHAKRTLSAIKDLIKLQATNTTSTGKEPYDLRDLRPVAQPIDLDPSQQEKIRQDWEDAKHNLAASAVIYDACINEREHSLRNSK